MTAIPCFFLLLSAVTGARPAAPHLSAAGFPAAACAVVTRAEVEDVLGFPVGTGREGAEGLATTCDYTARSGGQVTITVQRLKAALDLPAEKKSLLAAIPDSSVREAPEIGTSAFFLDLAGAGTQLHVIRGERDYLMVSILGFGDAGQVSEAAGKLVRKALGRLQNRP